MLVKMKWGAQARYITNEGVVDIVEDVHPAASTVCYSDGRKVTVNGTPEETFAALLGKTEKYRTDAEIVAALELALSEAFVDLNLDRNSPVRTEVSQKFGWVLGEFSRCLGIETKR